MNAGPSRKSSVQPELGPVGVHDVGERRRHAAAGQRREAAHRSRRKRQRDEKPDEHHDQLKRVDPRRSEQAAGREVDGHDRAAGQRAGPLRHAGEDVQNRRAGDQLTGKQGQRADCDECSGQASNGGTVAELEVVARRVEVVFLRQTPQPRRNEEGEHDRPETGRANPPPRAQPIPVGKT